MDLAVAMTSDQRPDRSEGSECGEEHSLAVSATAEVLYSGPVRTSQQQLQSLHLNDTNLSQRLFS